MGPGMFRGLDTFLMLGAICMVLVAVAILGGIGWGIYKLIAWSL